MTDTQEFWDRLAKVRAGLMEVNGRLIPMSPNCAPEDGCIWFLTARGTDAAEAANVPILVGHHRRYSSIMARAVEVIESGELGNIVAVMGSVLFYKAENEGYRLRALNASKALERDREKHKAALAKLEQGNTQPST